MPESYRPNVGARIANWIQGTRRHRFWIIVSILLAALASTLYSTRIRVDSDLDALLPKGSRTIHALDETKRRFGSADLFTISIVDPDPAEVARIQDRLRSRMSAQWPFVRSIQTERDQRFFRRNALLYLPPPQLERLERHIQGLRDDLDKGPLGMDLLSDAPAQADSTWFDADVPAQLGLPDEAAGEFRGFFRQSGADTAPDPKADVPDSLRPRLLGRLSDGRYVGLVQAVLSRPSSDIEFVKDVLSRSEILLEEIRSSHGKELEIGVEGPYKDLREVDSLAENGTVATTISVLLTILIMAVAFRRFGPILLVLGQAAISCVFTLGFSTFAYGRLNLYTVFVIAILFGMGTDYSFYVVGHAQRLVRRGRSWESALSQTFSDLAFSLLAAWATTTAGLLVLLGSKFPGFHEFGTIASVGIASSLALTWAGLPAAVLCARDLSRHRWLRWLSPDPTPEAWEFPYRPWMSKVPRWCAFGAIAGAIVLAPFASRIGFEYDFSKLMESKEKGVLHRSISSIRKTLSPTGGRSDDGEEKTLPVQEALGTNRTSSQPVVLLVDDPAVLDRLHDTLLRRLGVERDTLLAGFLTPRSFTPRAQDQAARVPHLRRIGQLLRDPVFDKASGKDSEMVALLRDMATARPFAASDIPSWATDLLRERDGSVGRVGFIYDKITNADARDASKFESRYGHFDGVGGRVSCFSSSFVYADLVDIVRSDSLRMAWTMAAVLCALVALAFRRWRPILVSFLGMAVSLSWILGIMGLFDIRLGVFNLIVITTVQGALTDVVLYLVLAWERQGRRGVRELYLGMGTLMSVAIGTTLSGFAGMLFTTHLGIRSIGSFAVVGLGFCLLGSLAVTPWLCTKLLPAPPTPPPFGDRS